MEKRTLPILLHLFLSNILCSKMAAAQTTPIRVLEVVLNMDEYGETTTFNCFPMPLSDFYSTHQHYKSAWLLLLLKYRHTITSINSSDLERFGAWDEGPKLIQTLSNTTLIQASRWAPSIFCSSSRGWPIPKKLRVGVLVKAGFGFTWNPTGVEGYCIHVFDEVIKALPYAIADEAVYDLDPLYLEPFQCGTSFFSLFFIGFFIWILQGLINQNSRGFWYQVGLTFWFAFSTVVFTHKERAARHLWRLVLIIWFLVVLILTQSYAASLASVLTVQKLQSTVTDVDLLINNREIYIGYMHGSFVYGLLKGMNFDESRLVEYDSPEKLDELLSNGTIAAAFHETPYVKLFLGKYCSKYTTIGPINKATGFGIVLVIGSHLVTDVSCEVLDVTEGQKMAEMERKWLGDVMKKCLEYSNELVWGMFIGMTALIIYVVRFVWITVTLC